MNLFVSILLILSVNVKILLLVVYYVGLNHKDKENLLLPVVLNVDIDMSLPDILLFEGSVNVVQVLTVFESYVNKIGLT